MNLVIDSCYLQGLINRFSTFMYSYNICKKAMPVRLLYSGSRKVDSILILRPCVRMKTLVWIMSLS